MWPTVALFAALLLSSGFMLAQSTDTSPAAAAPGPAPQPLPKPQFFGGTVTALSDQQITVSHAPVGRTAERRTFLINLKTKMNKSVLKLRSRVTVRYQHLPGGDVALEILLQPRPPRASKLT